MTGEPDGAGAPGAQRGGKRPRRPAAPGRLPGPASLTRHGRTALRSDAVVIAAAALGAADPAAALHDLIGLKGDDLLVGGSPHTGLQPPPAGRPARAPAAGEVGAPARTTIPLAGRRVFVLGAGKATIGMAELLDRLLGERIAAGCVVVKHGQGRRLRHVEVVEAAHPVPDEGSLSGGCACSVWRPRRAGTIL